MNKKVRITVLFFIIVLVITLVSIDHSYAATSWLESSIQTMVQSDWFQDFGYGDCSSSGPWPYNFWDCIIPDDNIGPSDYDTSLFPDPPGLYYKHLTPSLSSNSGESLVVGLQGSSGEVTWSLSLMVHPETELPILGSVTPAERVEELYYPYVIGATGLPTTTIAITDVVELYIPAVYTCDRTASDQSGLGTYKQWGDFVAVVQRWDMHEDCNIHVFNTTSELPPTPTNTPEPTPTDTPLPTDTPTPTNTPLPTNTPTVTNTPSATLPPTDTPLPTNTPVVDTTSPTISDIEAVDITGTTARIIWDTDEPSDSWVEYGYENKTGKFSFGHSSILDTALVVSHSVTLTNLKVDKIYHYRVYSADAAGNTSHSDDQIFISTPGPNPDPTETPDPEQTPTSTPSPTSTPTSTPETPTVEPTPEPFNITDVEAVDVTKTTATIIWNTDIPSDSQVEFGIEKTPGVINYTQFSALDPTLVTSHSILLTDLKKNNTFHFRVISTDDLGNTVISGDYTFTTPLK